MFVTRSVEQLYFAVFDTEPLERRTIKVCGSTEFRDTVHMSTKCAQVHWRDCVPNDSNHVWFQVLQSLALSTVFIYLFHNYARKQLLHSAHLSHRHSVCLSICPSHGWISQKWCKLGSPNLHRRLPGRL